MTSKSIQGKQSRNDYKQQEKEKVVVVEINEWETGYHLTGLG